MFVMPDATMDGKEIISVTKTVMLKLVIGIMEIVMPKPILLSLVTNVLLDAPTDGKEITGVMKDV